MALRFPRSRSEFMGEVQGELGTAERGVPTASECYQCGKCTAGCPVAYEMEIPPHQMMRAVQLGMRDAALSSRTIWICAACETCSARCPQDADPAGVMDALRRIAFAEGIKSPEPDVPLFHRLFLGTVQQFGRVFEAGMIGLYNVFSGHYTKDLGLAPTMFLKGKLGLLPSMHGNRKVMKKLFAADAEHRADARRRAASRRETSAGGGQLA
jgi:heterodisulfide reductase subunit C